MRGNASLKTLLLVVFPYYFGRLNGTNFHSVQMFHSYSLICCHNYMDGPNYSLYMIHSVPISKLKCAIHFQLDMEVVELTVETE